MNNKISAWIKLRKQPQVLNSIKQPVIWLHASSGEIEFVKSYIRDLKKMKPEYSIVVSYSSPSAQKLFDNIKPYVDQFFPLPWDQPQAIRKVLAHYNPTAIYFARTDLWPEFLYQLKVSRVKSYIVSYNPHLGFFNKLWIKLFLKNFTGLFCLNEIQEAALKEILPTGVKILAAGDTRYDQVFWRLQQPSKIPFQIPEPYFVFGSTWKEDEDIFVPLFAEFKKLGIKIVWCPHEIDNSNMDRIEKVLSTEKIDYQKVFHADNSRHRFNSFR